MGSCVQGGVASALVMDGGMIIFRVGYSGKIHVPWSEKPFLFCTLRCLFFVFVFFALCGSMCLESQYSGG